MKRETTPDRIAPEPPFLRDPAMLTGSLRGLQVYSAGEILVLGFGGNEAPDPAEGLHREEVLDLIDLHRCRTVAFDLTDVDTISPSMLRILTSARCRCALVRLFNASDEICAQLRRANLTQFFEMNVEMFAEDEHLDAEHIGETNAEACSWTA